MKCPKCGYLGFDTGEQCRNCGYDFSLIASTTPNVSPDPDLAFRTDDAETGPFEVWLDRTEGTTEEEAAKSKLGEELPGLPRTAPQSAASDAGLPLFNPHGPDDIPLIALPAAPRPPLAVRRTPETPRLRAVTRVVRHQEPALDFRARTEEEPEEVANPEPVPMSAAGPALQQPAPERAAPEQALRGTPKVGLRRVAAAAIDHAMLIAIDAIVVYFTLRMSGLGVAEVAALPVIPIATFLVILKLAYFSAFTSVGGQTIGKMAAGIRVVGDNHGPVNAACAIRRTLASVVSLLPLGLGFMPAFVGADRRTLHDRVAHTRVVSLR
jgi:uncharacterized RDD family membrane protein YckC